MKENDKYLSGLSKKPLARIIAWICLIIIISLIIATFVTGIMGSGLFLPFLALTIVIPFFMYIALWLGKVLNGSGVDDDTLDVEEDINDK
ncbi:MAG: hypothetical protein IJV15_10110 [Lachnospiraceae bacterium]|nr:hypothetical protein [Lachnospiraceae bacterium]